MAHEFESGFFAGNRKAWHGLGTVIKEQGVHVDRALELGGIDWHVDKVPIMYKDVPVEGKFLTVRTDTDTPIEIVGSDYTVIQNREAFEFMDLLVDHEEVQWDSAGSLKGGRWVFGNLKLVEDVVIAGMSDERMERYITLLTSHDGSVALRAQATHIRTVCANTFSANLQGGGNKYVVKHGRNAELKLQDARAALDIVYNQTESIQAAAERLLRIPVGVGEFDKLLAHVLPVPPMPDRLSDITEKEEKAYRRAFEKREQHVAGYRHTFECSPNIENIRRTGWGALNAIVEYDDHHTQYTHRGNDPILEKRMVRIMQGHTTTQRAQEYLLAQ